MGDILQSRFSALLKRALVLKHKDPGAYVGAGVVPGIEIQDQYQPEVRLMRGERLFGLCTDQQNSTTAFAVVTWTNPQASGKIVVVRRVGASGVLPTATNQPGRGCVFVRATSGPGGGVAAGANGLAPDGRLLTGLPFATTSTPTPVTSGYNGNNSNIGITYSSFIIQCLWAQEIFPQAAVSNFAVVSPDLDVVIPPGAELRIGTAFTALPLANWNMTYFIQGYERIVDAAELIPPP